MKPFFPVTLCILLGCGLMAGLFFAFSVCVMKALGQLPPDKGITAMQSINVAILNPVFFTIFFGTAATCALTLVSSFLHWHAPGARYLFTGSVFYLVGVLLVTVLFNVPMNETLASSNPASHDSAHLWATYLTIWTAWNHVRTIAALAAMALFALALCQPTDS
ncbi:putative membrane protein [Abditibacterium utsteinense]|uniref:Putative membrane protein n=1 Tax=Abditibacterium utsteinense TaxID=1960156 RepID=A0A2S8SPT2_9BACT|nr:anthrone oxygenase family protein [Abditibacterium utsteinense]PQV62786.1 putative membrane protein [Abditibacterium utsteinense]